MATHATIDQKGKRPLINSISAWRVQEFARISNRNPSEATNVLIEKGWNVVTEQQHDQVMPAPPGIDKNAPRETASFHMPSAIIEAVRHLAAADHRSISGMAATLISEALNARAAGK
jgi:hypothetical protein